jgi:hypothetical protein
MKIFPSFISTGIGLPRWPKPSLERTLTGDINSFSKMARFFWKITGVANSAELYLQIVAGALPVTLLAVLAIGAARSLGEYSFIIFIFYKH